LSNKDRAAFPVYEFEQFRLSPARLSCQARTFAKKAGRPAGARRQEDAEGQLESSGIICNNRQTISLAAAIMTGYLLLADIGIADEMPQTVWQVTDYPI
jgi:hypothetical protein